MQLSFEAVRSLTYASAAVFVVLVCFAVPLVGERLYARRKS